jgi:hypothetical protein
MAIGKWRWLVPVLGLGVGITNASAEVVVQAVVVKTKAKTVTHTIDKQKTITINVVVEPQAEIERAAFAEAIVNQLNGDPEGQPEEANVLISRGAERLLEITDSGNDTNGILVVNQSAGNLNNQAGAISVAFTDPEAESGGYADAQAAAEQENLANTGLEEEGEAGDGTRVPMRRTLDLSGSFDNGQGIISVNQTVGDFNNQVNAATLAVVPEGGVAISEAELGQTSYYNLVLVDPRNTARMRTYSNNTGIVTVNASAGVGSNQGNLVSFSVAGTQSQ